MECTDFESIAVEVARDRLIEASARESAIAHRESCPRCAARLLDERALTAGLRAMIEADRDLQTPRRVEDSLIAAFRERAGSITAAAKASRRARWIRVAAAAAIIIIAAIIASRHQSAPSPEAKRPEDPVHDQTPFKDERKRKLEELAPVMADDKSEQKRRRNNLRSTKASHQPDRAATSQTEIATDFFPLVGYDNLINFDSGEIRRVKLSRPALISLGLPVNMDLASEPVKADVLVGHDGLARAIRFIR